MYQYRHKNLSKISQPCSIQTYGVCCYLKSCTDDYNTQVYINRIVYIHRLHYVEKNITVTLATGSNNGQT